MLSDKIGEEMKIGPRSSRLLLLLVVGLFLGCGGDSISDTFREMNKLKMRKLANSYVMFASVNDSVGPKDADELKNFIQTDERVPPRLGMSSGDLDNLDDLFISDADGEPFTIRYGLKIRTDEDRSPLVFDNTGVDGMRRVALADNRILEVTNEKRYQRLMDGRLSDKENGIDEVDINESVEVAP